MFKLLFQQDGIRWPKNVSKSYSLLEQEDQVMNM